MAIEAGADGGTAHLPSDISATPIVFLHTSGLIASFYFAFKILLLRERMAGP